MIKFLAGSGLFVAGMGFITCLLTHDPYVLLASLVNLTLGMMQLNRLEAKDVKVRS